MCVLIAALVSASILTTSVLSVSANEKLYIKNRLYGQDRIQTSIEIANEYINNNQVKYIVLATANNFPDALTGSVLAAKYDAPILLVGDTVLESKATLDFIKSHLIFGGQVFILGGTGAVSSDIESAVRNLGISNIQRLGGENRAETSKAINDVLNVQEGTPVIITTENDFPDALSASSFAGINKFPILLSDEDSLPQPTIDLLEKIKPSKIFVIGGKGVVSENAVSQIKIITNIMSDDYIKRVCGSDRYSTSLAIANEFNTLNPYFSDAVLATGENFPDALSGSALAFKKNAPIILVNDDKASSQKQYLDSTYVYNLTFLGGTGAISSSVEDLFKTDKLKQAVGLHTPSGIVTSKIKYDDPIRKGASFEELRSIATPVNPKDNPELFTDANGKGRFYLDESKMGLTDKLYYYSYTYNGGTYPVPFNCEVFVKILGFYYDYGKNTAFAIYSRDFFMSSTSIIPSVGDEEHEVSEMCVDSKYVQYLKNEK